MAGLMSVQKRFEVPLKLIEGGVGTLHGVLSEAEQNSQPTYVFANPRKVLRVPSGSMVKTGMVLETPHGEKLLVGENGPSENKQGTLWLSFRMFLVTHQVKWQRRAFATDPVTQRPRDIGVTLMGNPWMVVEPLDREANDSKLRHSFEVVRFVAGAEILADDLIDGHPVTKADSQLGLRVGFYT